MTLAKKMSQLARQAGGSHKTLYDRVRMVRAFCTFLQKLNIQIKQLDHIKSKYFELYVAERLSAGIDKRTVQNELAALRKVLRLAGREKLMNNERLSNKGLGVSQTDRSGKKAAIPDTLFQEVLAKVYQKDLGLATTLKLARLLGLRSQEAVQCSQSLATWQKALIRGDEYLPVVFGTKGGKPRKVRIIDREEIMKTVQTAIMLAKQQNGRVINKPNLKTAMTYWHNHLSRLGLNGKYSPHSLRYAWVQDATRYYKAEGYSENEAYALASMDVGHGDGRGRYVRRVYGK